MSKHFSMSEFSSPSMVNGKANYRKRLQVPAKYRASVNAVMYNLEIVRTALGSVPIHIASGWRDKAFNDSSNGRASRSKHLVGKAADVQVKGVSPARVYWVISDLIRDGVVAPGGLAKYSTFCHYDTRGRYRNGRMARWKPTPKRPRSGLGSDAARS